MAAERNLDVGTPPQIYRLDEVSVRLTRHPGRPNFPVQRVSLSGNGSAMLERDKQQLPFQYAAKDVMVLLNDFYRIRFFDMAKDYSIRYSVFNKDDGTIGTSLLRMSDAPSTIVCFAVATYEKCVTYTTEGPYELEKLTQRIFSEADKLVNLKH